MIIPDKSPQKTPVVAAQIILCAGGLLHVFGESLISQIGWRGADRGVMAGIIAVLLSGMGTLLVLHIRVRNRVQADETELSENLFAQSALDADLTATEKKRLEELLRHAHFKQNHIIFQSIGAYERCVDQEISVILSSPIDPEKLKEEETILSSLRKKLGYSFLPLEHPLVSTRNISIGQQLSIYGVSHQTPIISSARAVYNREFMLGVQYDLEKEEFHRITPGMELKLAFARQNDGVYGISMRVLSFDGAGLIEFLHTLDLRRNQLRQFVRVEANFPIRCRLVRTEIEENKGMYNQVMTGKTADISGGGLSYLAEKPLAPGDIVSLNFQLPNVSLSGISAKVLRVSLQEGKTTTFYRHHLQFQNLEPRERDRIVKFVFEKQRQMSQWR